MTSSTAPKISELTDSEMKKRYSRNEHYNLFERTPLEEQIDPNQDLNRRYSFLRLIDTFIYGKKSYKGKK
ncbi:MAG: hypothetical protein LBD75_07145 [Candidatus Peribacteria bacterium]|nr:hypothetical protein [Candidatus Peribacteria bacterium]